MRTEELQLRVGRDGAGGSSAGSTVLDHPSAPRVQVEWPETGPGGPRGSLLGNRRLNALPTATMLLLADAGPTLLAAVTTPEHWRALIFMAGLIVALNLQAGLYKPRLHLSILDDLPALLARYITAASVTLMLAGMVGEQVDRAHFGTLLVAVLVAGVLLRAAGYDFVRSSRRRGWVHHRTVIVGGGRVGVELADLLAQHQEYGLTPVGYLDDRPVRDGVNVALPYLGRPGDVHEVMDRTHSSILLFAFGRARDEDMISSLRVGPGAGYDLFVVPRLFEVTGPRTSMDHIGAIPVVRIARVRHRELRLLMKRAFDLVAVGLALLVLSPVLLACALAVRATGPGVLFRQPRVGKDGRVFELYKFRSMAPVTDQDSATTWSVSADPRVTGVGRFLRRTSLDELPQLWNILVGDMTIVGPRPERPYFVEQFSREFPAYQYRHRVPVGLTGLAQVSGLRGGDSSIERRARYDNYYIEHWSLWGDVKVIVRTCTEVLAARGG